MFFVTRYFQKPFPMILYCMFLYLKAYLRLAPRSFSLIQCVVSFPVSRHRSRSPGQVWRQLLVCPPSSTTNHHHRRPCLQRSTTLHHSGSLHWVSVGPCALSPCSQTPFGDRSLGKPANTIFRRFPFTARHPLSPLHQLLPLRQPPLPVEKQPGPWN